MNLQYDTFYIELFAKEEKIDEESMFSSKILPYLSMKPMYQTIEEAKICINLWHELNHLVQDLCCNACITKSEFQDSIAGHLRVLANNDKLRFPYHSPNHKLFNDNLQLDETTSYDKWLLDVMLDIYDFIFKKGYTKPNSNEYSYKSKNEFILEEYQLTYADLLETYAFHKSYVDILYNSYDEKSHKILRTIIEQDKLFPVEYDNGQFNIDILHLKTNMLYQLIPTWLTLFLPYDKQYLEELYKDYYGNIPQKFKFSKVEQHYIAMFFIIETALNIPSFEYIIENVINGKYRKETFCPPLRFYKILKTIREYGGFPNATENENFFITFNNWIAQENGWPSYEDTANSMIKSLIERKLRWEENITNIQLNSTLDRNKNPYSYIFAPPTLTLKRLKQSILFCNNLKFEVFFYENSEEPFWMPFVNFQSEFFSGGIPHKFQLILEKDSENTKHLKRRFNNLGIVREIIHRQLSHTVTNAFLYDGIFKCPCNKNTCPFFCQKCKALRDIDDVRNFCPISILRTGQGKFVKKAGEGNYPHCMLYNYILDFNYNLSKLYKQ